jgi:hypothetical protein
MEAQALAIAGSVMASIITGAVFWFSRSVKKLYDTVQMQSALVNSMSVEMQEVQSRLNRIESDKIGWDVLFRIERSLALLSQQGQGNEAMSLVAKVVGQEVAARNEK